jgi:nitroreductase
MTMPPAEILEGCIRSAITAPSLHNSQPWLFRISDGVVDVYADWRRQLEVLDPTGRELLISIGAAVFTLGLALRGAGYRPEVCLLPDAGKPDLVARVSADRRQRAAGGYRAELARWTTHRTLHRDGVPPLAIGPWDALESMPIRDFGLLQPHLARTVEEFEPDPTLVVLATAGDDRADWVRAGQALQRVLLTATWQHLATTPVSQPVEIPAVRRQLSDPGRGIWAQMILRIGYGRPAATTPRRPLSEVLLTSTD